MNSGFLFGYIGLWAIVLFQAILCVGLVREVGRLRGLPVLERLPVGGHIPQFAGRNIDSSARIFSRELFSGSASIALILHAECVNCRKLAEEIGRGLLPQSGHIIALCLGEPESVRTLASLFRSEVTAIVDLDADVTRLFGVKGTPTAVWVDEKGLVQRFSYPQSVDELIQFEAAGGSDRLSDQNEHTTLMAKKHGGKRWTMS